MNPRPKALLLLMLPNLPVNVVASIFRLRRDLVVPIKLHVIAGSGITLEKADLLMDLYGAKVMRWLDPPADEAGYVTFRALKQSLVHSQALLSRRITELETAGLVETKKTKDVSQSSSRANIDPKSKSVRISSKGISVIAPVYKKYEDFCELLFQDISVEDQNTLLRLNESVMNKLRWKK